MAVASKTTLKTYFETDDIPTQSNFEDLIDSMQAVSTNAICDAYVSSSSASNAITATTYLNVLANATLADGGQTGSEFTIDNTNKRFTYTGTDTRLFVATLAISMTSTKSNEVSSFRLAENGTTAAATQIDRKIGTGADVGALCCQGTFSLATNDYIELWATLTTSTSDTITVNYCNISIHPVS